VTVSTSRTTTRSQSASSSTSVSVSPTYSATLTPSATVLVGSIAAPPSIALFQNATFPGVLPVALNVAPRYNVVVTVTSSNASVTVTPSSLVFTVANFSLPQLVTVSVNRFPLSDVAMIDVTLRSSAQLTALNPGAYISSAVVQLVVYRSDVTLQPSLPTSGGAIIEGATSQMSLQLSGTPIVPVTVACSLEFISDSRRLAAGVSLGSTSASLTSTTAATLPLLSVQDGYVTGNDTINVTCVTQAAPQYALQYPFLFKTVISRLVVAETDVPELVASTPLGVVVAENAVATSTVGDALVVVAARPRLFDSIVVQATCNDSTVTVLGDSGALATISASGALATFTVSAGLCKLVSTGLPCSHFLLSPRFLMSDVSCLLSLVSCLLSLVSCLLSLVSCLLSLVSCLLSLVSCLLSLVSCLLSLVSCLLSLVSCPCVCCLLLSDVWCLMSVVGCLLF
jgi:hypothetical protein